jgi:hypothetical protein
VACCAAVRRRCAGAGRRIRAYLTIVSDLALDGATVEQLTEWGTQAGLSFALIADERALSEPEHSLLVVSFYEEPGRTFRVIPSEVWGVENNLSLANMGFDEFADAVDEDGVFRGFHD